MSLREGDSKHELTGKVVWFIGRSGAGKSSLIEAIKLIKTQAISLDDHLRCRARIVGADMNAYNAMIGLSWALAYQGFDVLLPCGAPSVELRAYIKSQIPSLQFVYIAERGRYYEGYEEPQPDEGILVLDAGLTTEQEVEIVLERIWKSKFTKS